MEKVHSSTPDLVQANIEAIAELFPNVMTESVDDEGKLVQAVDFDQLRQELSDHVVDGPQERYRLDWPGKRAAMLAANAPTRSTLRPMLEESVNFDTTKNIFIEGDNLEALKNLQESYLGKVKLIYIDPPYNTGNDFIYKDDFAESNAEYLERSGQVDESGARLSANTESNGRFHSDWLSMIYPRLKLARNLLTRDGVVFISIDDSEQSRLEAICDEIFGNSNFIAKIVRNTNSSKNQSLFVSVSHEYCLVYARDIVTLGEKHSLNKWSVPKNNIDEYLKKVSKLRSEGLSNEDITAELKLLTNYPRFIDFTNYWYFDDRGLYRKDNLGGVKNGNKTPLHNPLTGTNDPVPPGGYRFSAEKLAELVSDHRIHFHTDGSLPTIKRYLDENESQRPKSIMSDDQRPDYAALNRMGTPFDNPKQLAFMKRIVGISDRDALVLDFFGGSGTTAQAVLELNEETGSERSFILIQIAEAIPEGSAAGELGHTDIAALSRARIRVACEAAGSSLDFGTGAATLGFRSFTVSAPGFMNVLSSPDVLQQAELPNLVSNVEVERTREDLLFEVLRREGLEPSLPVSRSLVDGCTVFSVDSDALMACLDQRVPPECVRTIATRHPVVAVFRDAAFATDAERINVDQIFRELSPDTQVRVI
jgi:adenine-specific DNA-methyltransferase